ncbi:hypothetical protein ACSFA8_24735 [Variovorax sp. RT4R15]|uniref:hypothetical protein n=1 Tax=Variovorax sp. RT4R15 TaxID=3443737 RepID=UPI003F46D658
MAMELLGKLSASRLPVTLRTPAEIDELKALRAAGLVIALTPDSPATCSVERGAQVIAITREGLEQLSRFRYPEKACARPLRARRHSTGTTAYPLGRPS